MLCATLMVQGTTSDAGKSTLVAALCRIFYRHGAAVVPFKPQNMALNSAVTVDGGEIGRAQALQAEAAGLAPTVDMNPILLKPTTDRGAQVIIHGQVHGQMNAADYHAFKATAMTSVLASHDRLRQQFELILVEGAGSPAEINLRANDIANMGFAEAVDCPVILVADIDRGGVFAHIVGTLALLSESERARVKGFVINRFRGDIELLQPGLDWLQEYTGKPVLGVLPFLSGFHIDGEDAINPIVETGKSSERLLRVVVPVLPRISNHTDFDPLRLHPQIELTYVRDGDPVPASDLIILPGTKNTLSDFAWLEARGWGRVVQTHLRYGGKVLGICGGFQMLGDSLADPLGIEGSQVFCQGFRLLSMATTLEPEKQLRRRHGRLQPGGAEVEGYEIHAGHTEGVALERPFIAFDDGSYDGAISEDGQVAGTYLHGLFDTESALNAVLQWAGLKAVSSFDYQAHRQSQIERLADSAEQHLNIAAIKALVLEAKR